MRSYIIPVSPADVNLTEWQYDLQRYGIDNLLLINAVVRSYLQMDENPSGNLMAYVSEAACHMYSSEIGLSSAIAQRAFEEEMDHMTLVCMEACETMLEHLRPYFLDIEAQETSKGYDITKTFWFVSAFLGTDVVLELRDLEEHENAGLHL